MPRRTTDPLLRFARDIVVGDGCWEWHGTNHGDGYGIFTIHGQPVRAHRYAFEAFVGPVPVGLVLDHVCRNRRCVRPDHLEPVTMQENTRRSNAARTGPTCPKGHAFTPENTRLDRTGSRRCRKCARAWDRRRSADGAA